MVQIKYVGFSGLPLDAFTYIIDRHAHLSLSLLLSILPLFRQMNVHLPRLLQNVCTISVHTLVQAGILNDARQ